MMVPGWKQECQIKEILTVSLRPGAPETVLKEKWKGRKAGSRGQGHNQRTQEPKYPVVQNWNNRAR